MNITYDDEVTSVVSSDQHRSSRNEALDDEVVEQSVINFSDDYDEEQDERRNLLYRGSGREAIERARQRARQRRQQPVVESDVPEPVSPDEDVVIDETNEPRESIAASFRKPVFEPDDFVEEENPSAEEQVDENDDALLSEGIRTLTPREARLRRFRDERPAPKDLPAAKIEPAPDDVEMVLPPSAAPERGRFDSIPEISAEIDLPLLRRSSSARNPVAEAPAPRVDEPEEAPASYERALKRAHAVNAAARAEQNASRRRVTIPVPRQEVELDSGVVMPDLPDDDEPVSMRRPAPVAETPSPPAHAEQPRQPTEARVRKPLIAAARPSQPHRPRHDDPRRSWWRGHREADEEAVPTSVPQDTEAEYAEHREEPYHERPVTPAADSTAPAVVKLNLERREDMNAFRDRLFANAPSREPEVESGDVAHRGPITVTRRQRPISPAARERYRAEREPSHQESRQPDRPRVAAPVEADSQPVIRQQRPRPPAVMEAREPRQLRPQDRHIEPEELLADPQDAWYEPAPEPEFDVRALIERDTELLDMTIEIAPDVPRACATCRNYRPSEQPGRGWCTNTWAFTHRQMVNETDLACDSTIGCWWLPADQEVWLTDFDPPTDPTPRVDRLIAHLDPERRVTGT